MVWLWKTMLSTSFRRERIMKRMYSWPSANTTPCPREPLSPYIVSSIQKYRARILRSRSLVKEGRETIWGREGIIRCRLPVLCVPKDRHGWPIIHNTQWESPSYSWMGNLQPWTLLSVSLPPPKCFPLSAFLSPVLILREKDKKRKKSTKNRESEILPEKASEKMSGCNF